MIRLIKAITCLVTFFSISYISMLVFYSKKIDGCAALWKSNAINKSVACYESIPFIIDSNAKIELFELHVDERFGISDPVKAIGYISYFSVNKKKEIINRALIYSHLKDDVRYYLNSILVRID